jgi:serine/threonine protein kinase
MCGTMGYVAPEILRQEVYTIAVDVWVAGIILFEMLDGIRPFVPYKDCLTVPLGSPPSVFAASRPPPVRSSRACSKSTSWRAPRRSRRCGTPSIAKILV